MPGSGLCPGLAPLCSASPGPCRLRQGPSPLVFTVCEYLWPFLLPRQDWEDSSILPALIKSVDRQICLHSATADDCPGASSLLRVGRVPLQPLGSLSPHATTARHLSNPLSPRRSHFSLPDLPAPPKSLLLEVPGSSLRIQGVERGWALCPPCSALSCPAGMGRPFPLLAFTCWAISSCFQLISAGTPGARPVSCPTLSLGVCSCLGGSFLLPCPCPWVSHPVWSTWHSLSSPLPSPTPQFSSLVLPGLALFPGSGNGEAFLLGDPMDPAQSSSDNMETASKSRGRFYWGEGKRS